MHTHRRPRIVLVGLLVLLISLLGSAGATGQSPSPVSGPLAEGSYADGVFTWRPSVECDGLVLTVRGPDDYYWQRTFGAGEPAVFDARDDAGNPLPDGQYVYELRIVLSKPADGTDPESPSRGLDSQASEAQSGAVAVHDGALLSPDLEEGGVTPLDVVHMDDTVITGSLCVGFDCLTDGSESFGFDTLRLKENNLQIAFDDTSSAAGFPANDWRIRANDSNSGGASYLAIDDVTAGRTPFRIAAGAQNNALYIGPGRYIGIGTAVPVKALHMLMPDTPALRLDQDTSGGFVAQAWDVAANEANFFVRDVTNGSALPFRIYPGSPSNALVVKGQSVGLGTSNPAYSLEVERAGVPATLAVQRTDGATGVLTSGVAAVSVGSDSRHALRLLTDGQVRVYIKPNGKMGIGNSNPTHLLTVGTSGAYTDGGAWVDGSSRSYKENIAGLDADEARDALMQLEPVRYTYTATSGEEYLGFIAEDVPALVATADRKGLAPMDIVAVLTSVVQ
ncbi:MAG: tail fiber domain-containing protein, partial [Chloroflexi bacterium]|nr:tail fiber domain-containing protein [Chloroflexota bacterium]